ncbi:glycosyltransferase family 2 protein [Burkholderia sp. Ac-20379]|uniref:glycosyltransferase family 2 protein n=1 Tax=Burkholderia sp. Ac-20379 TaxID=2703900 RepID=UPI001F11F224|nr:glycosyltransferase family A protein [Burkholderia sp. Ac-20379]
MIDNDISGEPVSLPSVTVVICNYNYGRFVGQAVDSALAQSVPAARVLVIDDGSTDDSVEIVRGYGAAVDLRRKENGGQVSAYNAAVDLLDTEIVIFLDADDFLYPEAVAEVAAGFVDPQVAKVQYRLDIFSSGGVATGSQIPNSRPPRDCGPSLRKGWLYPSPPASGNAYRVANLKRIYPIREPLDSKYGADFYAIYGIALTGQVGVIDHALGGYRAHAPNQRADKSRDISFANAAKWRDTPREFRERWQLLSTLAANRLGVALPADLMDFSYTKSVFVAELYGRPFVARVRWLALGSPRYFRSIVTNPYWNWRKKAALIAISLCCFVPGRRLSDHVLRFIANPLLRGRFQAGGGPAA